MGAKFWFFTDADELGAQTPAQAFGPDPAAPGIKFRVTDLHTAASASDPPLAYAICDGLLRARLDDEGGLTLILKPTHQPPFDFPFIASFLYKGVDPESLLGGGATAAPPWPLIKVANRDKYPLVDRIETDWPNNGNTGVPTRHCLGLHLHQDTPASAGLDPSLYAPGKPLDNLFYRGDGRVPPVQVWAGEPIGQFLADRFGLEVNISRVWRPPIIGFASKRENLIAASPMPHGAAADDVAAFVSRHEREATLDFIDPCALWGSFFQSTLRSHGTGIFGPKIKGKNIYTKVLLGPAGANFLNCNKAYIDVRNDHGHSFNYYRTTADEIQLSFDAGAPSLVSYYGDGGWPNLAVPSASVPLPGGLPGDWAHLQVALPAVVGSQPVIYVSVGFRARGRQVLAVRDRDRFIYPPPYSGLDEAVRLSLPMVQTDSGPVVHASYHKLHQFRRVPYLASEASPDPTSLAPSFARPTDHLFPVPEADPFPRAAAGSSIRVYSDFILLDSSEGVVARPGLARDQDNLYLFLLPEGGGGSPREKIARTGWPAFQELSTQAFRPDQLLNSGDRIAKKTLRLVENGGTVEFPLLYESSLPTGSNLSGEFWLIAMSAGDYQAATQHQSTAYPGTTTVSLEEPLLDLDEDLQPYERLAATLSYLKKPDAPGAAIARIHSATFRMLYRHASS